MKARSTFASITPTPPAPSTMCSAFAASWASASRRAFVILPIAGSMSLDARAEYKSLTP